MEIAEYDACQEIILHAYLYRGFHSSRHGSVYLSFDRSVLIDYEKLWPDTDYKVIIVRGSAAFKGFVEFLGPLYVVSEDFLLVALFDIVLFF